jgi:hypothetical protein
MAVGKPDFRIVVGEVMAYSQLDISGAFNHNRGYLFVPGMTASPRSVPKKA